MNIKRRIGNKQTITGIQPDTGRCDRKVFFHSLIKSVYKSIDFSGFLNLKRMSKLTRVEEYFNEKSRQLKVHDTEKTLLECC